MESVERIQAEIEHCEKLLSAGGLATDARAMLTQTLADLRALLAASPQSPSSLKRVQL
jgi:hypothetical protein